MHAHTGNEIKREFKLFDENKENNNDFFRNALNNNENILISCEKLGSLEDIELYTHVLQYFNTTIIMFYRDFLSIHISYYYQQRMTKTLVEYLTSEEIHSKTITSGIGGYNKRISLWNKVGVLVIPDYNGLAASKVSLQYVFLCDIAGIACLSKLRHNEVYNPTNIEHVREQTIHRLFSAYANARGCKVDFKHISIDVRDIPLIQRDLSHFIEYSNLLDEQFRERYGSLMMYSNTNATRIATAKHRIFEDIDIPLLLLNPIWQDRLNKWMDKEIILHKATCEEVQYGGSGTGSGASGSGKEPYRYRPSGGSVA